VPINVQNNFKIYAPFSGYVWYDQDDARKGGAYGNMIVIADPYEQINAYFCHLQMNSVAIGTWVKAGDFIGVMGETGNCQGKHLHLMINEWKGGRAEERRNYDNGYRGMIDPLPFVKEWCGG
jgi:Membrane proteins related to metalloendopeptidases